MTGYRFLDGMGDVVAQGEHAERAEAVAWVEDASVEDVHRVQ